MFIQQVSFQNQFKKESYLFKVGKFLVYIAFYLL